MADWQITATTIYCQTVASEVTVLVRGDFSATCTGFAKYGSIKAKRNNVKPGRNPICTGLDCLAVRAYIEKLRAEDVAK